MIDAIEIEIGNGFLNRISALIVYHKKICYLNNKKYNISDEYLEKIKRIIFTWKHEYGTSREFDVEEFQVKVLSKGKEDIYHGKGYYPNNYNELKDILGELNGR